MMFFNISIYFNKEIRTASKYVEKLPKPNQNQRKISLNDKFNFLVAVVIEFFPGMIYINHILKRRESLLILSLFLFYFHSTWLRRGYQPYMH